MIEKLLWYRLGGTEPYENLAVEEYLTSRVRHGELILLLWQNRKSVVIGRNQNCFEECRLELLEKEDGLLVRRRSGGGAVYHDLGNLNFSFIAERESYDLKRQFQVVLAAVQSLGVKAEVSGRNDIIVDGKKISGNAFTETDGKCCHHGTLMISVETEMLERYLRVPEGKLSSKGIPSVSSRVTNLSDWIPGLTVEQAGNALLEAFGRIYGQTPEKLPGERLKEEEAAILAKRFSSEKWLYGRRIPFNRRISGRFLWGSVELLLEIQEGKVIAAEVYSDAMAPDAAGRLREKLLGCSYRAGALAEAVKSIGFDNDRDLPELILKHMGVQEGETG